MRYGRPGVAAAAERLIAAGAERLVVLPMFPQYSGATTGSVYDAVTRTLLARRRIPRWRFVHDYPVEPGYVDAVAAVVRRTLSSEKLAETHLVISFHGVPRRYVDEGDPYEEQCRATAEALRTALALPAERVTLAYQSQFGREEWIGPATDAVLEKLARAGTKSVAAVCPGFTTDCLETIDEIGREAAETFREAGGEDFTYVPCVNDDPTWIDTMAALVRREAREWT
jgi:ferrochelatase